MSLSLDHADRTPGKPSFDVFPDHTNFADNGYPFHTPCSAGLPNGLQSGQTSPSGCRKCWDFLLAAQGRPWLRGVKGIPILPIFANCGDPGKGAVRDCGNCRLSTAKARKRPLWGKMMDRTLSPPGAYTTDWKRIPDRCPHCGAAKNAVSNLGI